MRKPKRVRFVGDELGNVSVRDSPERHEATAQSPRSDDAPKTSEFAYFRKVKSRAVGGHSCLRGEENKKLKVFKINNLITETSRVSDMSMTHSGIKDFKSLDSGGRAGPSDPNLFLSPRSRGSKYDEEENIDKSQKRPSSPFENGTSVGQSSFLSPAHEASENAENEYGENGIFSAKRHRLRKWATHTLFPEVEKPFPKGFDFVSALMSRLFPKINGNNDTSEGDADNSSKSSVPDKAINPDKGLHLSHKWDLDKDTPNISPGRPSRTILSESDSFVSRYLSHNYGTKTQAQDFLDQHPKSLIGKSPHTENDFSFFVPFDRYRQAESFPFEGLNDQSIADSPRTKPVRPLLEWDFDWAKNRTCSPIFNGDPEKNLYLGFSPSWIVDQTQMSDSRQFSNYFVEFDSLPNPRLDFKANFYDVKNGLTEPGLCSLALTSSPKCITPGEDINAGNALCYQNLFFSYRDNQWPKNGPQSDFWLKDSFTSDIYAEDYPSTFHDWLFPENDSRLCSLSRVEADAGENLAPFSGGASFYRNFRSSNLRLSFSRFMDRPLLLDHTTRDRSGQKLLCNDDDDDNELKCR